MRKINYSKVFILGVFIYIVFQVGTIIVSKNIKMEVLKSENLELKLHTKGLIIRDEYLVKSNNGGRVDVLVKAGEKVKKSQDIAKIYNHKKDETLDEKIKKIDYEIEEIKKDGVKGSIEKAKLNIKDDEKKILQNQMDENISTLKSDISGVISFNIDDNEEKYNYDYFDEITEEDIENAENNYYKIDKNGDKIYDNEVLMRVINTNDVYVAICVDKKNDNNFKVGQDLKLKTKEENIDAKIEGKYVKKSNIVIILKITNQNVGIYDTRVEEFDIIYKEIEGLKIPKEAIRTVDGHRGVYVVDESSESVKFKRLEGIMYENNNFVFLDCYKNKINGIKTADLYDKIILKPNKMNIRRAILT